MTIRSRLRRLERQARDRRPPATARDLSDYELAAVIGRETGLTPAEVLALADADLAALMVPGQRRDGP